MEELQIGIDELKSKLVRLQLVIGSPFEYGRSPGDSEYFDIADVADELRVVQHKLDFAEEIMEAIESNAT
jgi:hypothetical protein